MDGIISLHKSVLGSGERVKEESKASDQSNGDEQSCVQEIVFQQVAAKNDGISPPSHKNLSCSKQLDDQTKVEIDEVMEENQRLKMYLDQLLKDYRTLEMQFRDVMRTNESPRTSYDHKEICAHEQIDLSLGIGGSARKITKIDDNDEARDRKQGLSLGLDCKFDLPENSPNPSFENSVVEEAGETRGLKCVKNVRDDEILQQNPSKRARVSVRVRCDTPTMDDGCQWRKYGQKIAKGNPCPRAYYRCTVAPSCPVRKQVQRCMNDTSILITTYEGTHSHPLPNSATAMASTTSSAASMLIAGSSTSEIGPIPSSTNLSENSKSKPALYLPNPSISSSPLFPTITLDFTSSSSHLNQLGAFAPRYPTTNLNFSCPLPVSYSKGGMLSYAPKPPDKTQTAASLSFGSQPYAPQYNSYLQKTIPNPNPNPNQPSLGPDTIAAATKAITSSPNFQSVLAAALTSIIDGSGGGAIVSSFPSSSNANKCASSFLNKSSSSTPDLTILSPPFPFPFSNSNKSKSNSTDDNSDHVV